MSLARRHFLEKTVILLFKDTTMIKQSYINKLVLVYFILLYFSLNISFGAEIASKIKREYIGIQLGWSLQKLKNDVSGLEEIQNEKIDELCNYAKTLKEKNEIKERAKKVGHFCYRSIKVFNNGKSYCGMIFFFYNGKLYEITIIKQEDLSMVKNLKEYAEEFIKEEVKESGSPIEFNNYANKVEVKWYDKYTELSYCFTKDSISASLIDYQLEDIAMDCEANQRRKRAIIDSYSKQIESTSNKILEPLFSEYVNLLKLEIVSPISLSDSYKRKTILEHLSKLTFRIDETQNKFFNYIDSMTIRFLRIVAQDKYKNELLKNETNLDKNLLIPYFKAFKELINSYIKLYKFMDDYKSQYVYENNKILFKDNNVLAIYQNLCDIIVKNDKKFYSIVEEVKRLGNEN